MARTKAAKRMTKNLEMDYVGYLPDWHSIDSYDDEKFPTMLNEALRHYGYFTNPKQMRKGMLEWLKLNEPDPKFIKAYKKSKEWRTPVPAYSLAMANLAGMPMKPEHFTYVIDKVTEAAFSGKSDEVEEDTEKAKAKPKGPSIQDRITSKVNDHILYFEMTYEDGIIERGEKHPKPEVRPYLLDKNVPPSLTGRIIDHFQAQLDEIKGSQGKTADEDLKEAYAHLKKADVKRFTDFYKALLADLEMYKEEKKVAKSPRRKKPQSKTKQIAKLNFLKRHDGLKLVSVNPEDVIDCTELWVYQTKYRKLGKYVTDGYTTLGVKGTTITGFAPNESVQKTLRKPKEQLAEFKKAGKVKLRKFMEEIKAVEIKLTGRINKDTILLKAVK